MSGQGYGEARIYIMQTWASGPMVLHHHVLALWKARIWEPEPGWSSVLMELGAMPAMVVTQTWSRLVARGMKDTTHKGPAGAAGQGGFPGGGSIGPETWWESVNSRQVGGTASAKALGQVPGMLDKQRGRP